MGQVQSRQKVQERPFQPMTGRDRTGLSSQLHRKLTFGELWFQMSIATGGRAVMWAPGLSMTTGNLK
jgi:hypothetical protein